MRRPAWPRPRAPAVPSRDPARSPRRHFPLDADARARGMRGTGCWVRGAARRLGPRGDARPRRRKDTQARRGVQVPQAGTRVPPPDSLATCRASRSARAHPGSARAPQGTTYPVMGTAAIAASAPAGAVTAGGRPAGNDPLQGRKGPGTGQPGRWRGRDPLQRARVAAECSPRSAPAAAGDAARSAPAAALSAEGGRKEGGEEGGSGGGEEEEGGGSRRGGRRAEQGTRGSRAMRPVRALLIPRTRGAPALPGLAVPQEGAGRGGVGAAGNWGPWYLRAQGKS